MTSLFEGAGLQGVRVWDVPIHLTLDSAEEYWDLLTDCTAPVVAALQQVDDAGRNRITQAVIAEARTFALDDGRVALPATARCVVGTTSL